MRFTQLDLREGPHRSAGLHGWGEATLEWKTRAVTGAIEDLGRVCGRPGPDAHRAYRQHDDALQLLALGSIGLTAASGIEQALWDIKGKALGVPVWQLLAAGYATRCGSTRI